MTKSLLKNDSANLQKSPILLGFRAEFFNFLVATHLGCSGGGNNVCFAKKGFDRRHRKPSADWFDILFATSSLLTEVSRSSLKRTEQEGLLIDQRAFSKET